MPQYDVQTTMQALTVTIWCICDGGVRNGTDQDFWYRAVTLNLTRDEVAHLEMYNIVLLCVL